MNALLQDLRYGARMLMKQPGFTLIAIVTIALGTGANTAIFSLVNAVLLKPLPFAESERLTIVWEDQSSIGFPRAEAAPANFVDWKAQQSGFEDMAALSYKSFNLTGDGDAERMLAEGVPANLFPLLGVQPAIGRSF